MANKGMERFTQRARRVLGLAQEAAERLHHARIDTEHLLLALVYEEGGVAGRALRELGLDLRRVEDLVVKMKKPESPKRSGNFDLTAGTKRVMELAVDEARRMGHHYIGTEHLLLALVREPEGTAFEMLRRLGITPDDVRRKTNDILRDSPVLPPRSNEPQEPTSPTPREVVGASGSPSSRGIERFTLRARRVLWLAQEAAERLNHAHIGTEHLLLGLLNGEGGVAGRALRELGLDLRRVEEMVVNLKKPEAHPRAENVELTDDLKHVMVLAIDEAGQIGHQFIGPEHLLLALVRQPDGTAIEVLRRLGITPEEVIRQTSNVLRETSRQGLQSSEPQEPTSPTPRDVEGSSGSLSSRDMERFTQRARRVLELTQEVAKRLNHAHIGTHHLLLGLLYEEGGVAGRSLRKLGLDPHRVEELVVARVNQESVIENSIRTAELRRAMDEVVWMNHHLIGTSHLLLALMSHRPEDTANEVLRQLNITPEDVRRQVTELINEYD